jgi:hypothetical protein
MKEVRIECICPSIQISELHLDLKKGDVVWVSEEKAMSSDELKKAAKLGGVTLKFFQRCREVALPKDGLLGKWLSKPLKRDTQTNIPKYQKADTKIDLVLGKLDEMKISLRDTILTDVREDLKKERDNFEAEKETQFPKEGVPAPRSEDIAAIVEGVMRRVMQDVGTQVVTGQTHSQVSGGSYGSDPSVPVFIPKDIINEEIEAQITATSSESEDSSVDDAAAALRALKKKKKK